MLLTASGAGFFALGLGNLLSLPWRPSALPSYLGAALRLDLYSLAATDALALLLS